MLNIGVSKNRLEAQLNSRLKTQSNCNTSLDCNH